MYINTTRRITSGEELKLRKRLRIAGSYGTPAYTLSQIALTTVAILQIATELRASLFL